MNHIFKKNNIDNIISVYYEYLCSIIGQETVGLRKVKLAPHKRGYEG